MTHGEDEDSETLLWVLIVLGSIAMCGLCILSEREHARPERLKREAEEAARAERKRELKKRRAKMEERRKKVRAEMDRELEMERKEDGKDSRDGSAR